MALTRTPHWATRELHAFLLARAAMPFAWGTNDCAIFAADAIQAFTGTDIAAPFRGAYTTELGALKAIKTVANGTTVVDAVAWCAQQHGMVEWTHPLMARRGDLVIVADTAGPISGIVHLSGRHVVSVGQEGLKRLPVTAILRAWKV